MLLLVHRRNGAAYRNAQGSNGGSSKPDHFIVVKHIRRRAHREPLHPGLAGPLLRHREHRDPILSSLTLDSWVHNQYCVAVTSDTDIVMDNMYFYGGHGPSIGSIGSFTV